MKEAEKGSQHSWSGNSSLRGYLSKDYQIVEQGLHAERVGNVFYAEETANEAETWVARLRSHLNPVWVQHSDMSQH